MSPAMLTDRWLFIVDKVIIVHLGAVEILSFLQLQQHQQLLDLLFLRTEKQESRSQYFFSLGDTQWFHVCK